MESVAYSDKKNVQHKLFSRPIKIGLDEAREKLASVECMCRIWAPTTVGRALRLVWRLELADLMAGCQKSNQMM